MLCNLSYGIATDVSIRIYTTDTSVHKHLNTDVQFVLIILLLPAVMSLFYNLNCKVNIKSRQQKKK